MFLTISLIISFVILLQPIYTYVTYSRLVENEVRFADQEHRLIYTRGSTWICKCAAVGRGGANEYFDHRRLLDSGSKRRS